MGLSIIIMSLTQDYNGLEIHIIIIIYHKLVIYTVVNTSLINTGSIYFCTHDEMIMMTFMMMY